MLMTTAAYLGLLALLLGLVGDAISTIRVLNRGGRELNPFMRWVFDRMGVVKGFVIAKLMIASAATIAVIYALPHPVALIVWPLAGAHFWVYRRNMKIGDRLG